MYSLSRCLYLLQSLLITLFGDKNSCLEIRVMCCFSKPVEEGVGRHGFAALFTSPRRPTSMAVLAVPPPGAGAPTLPAETPPGAQHPACSCSGVAGGTQAQGHPGTAASRRNGGVWGHPLCAQQPVRPGRRPWVGFGALIHCQGAEQAPLNFVASDGSGAHGAVTRWLILCPCPGWARGRQWVCSLGSPLHGSSH